MSGRGTSREAWRDARRTRNRRGQLAEHAASLMLRLKGYRILGRRVQTGAGEIDLIAVRRGRLAFIEVKQRRTLADAEASISDRQRRRIRRGANLWLARHPRYQSHEQGFDLVFVLPWRWPAHIENGL
jgi:putative endonuclease